MLDVLEGDPDDVASEVRMSAADFVVVDAVEPAFCGAGVVEPVTCVGGGAVLDGFVESDAPGAEEEEEAAADEEDCAAPSCRTSIVLLIWGWSKSMNSYAGLVEICNPGSQLYLRT
jgi:hypothetical protein